MSKLINLIDYNKMFRVLEARNPENQSESSIQVSESSVSVNLSSSKSNQSVTHTGGISTRSRSHFLVNKLENLIVLVKKG